MDSDAAEVVEEGTGTYAPRGNSVPSTMWLSSFLATTAGEEAESNAAVLVVLRSSWVQRMKA